MLHSNAKRGSASRQQDLPIFHFDLYANTKTMAGASRSIRYIFMFLSYLVQAMPPQANRDLQTLQVQPNTLSISASHTKNAFRPHLQASSLVRSGALINKHRSTLCWVCKHNASSFSSFLPFVRRLLAAGRLPGIIPPHDILHRPKQPLEAIFS